MTVPIGYRTEVYLTIGGGKNIGNLFEKFEWISFTNGGYIIKGRCIDSYYKILRNIATDFYLQEGRKTPTRVVFEITHPGVPGENSTGKHVAYMTEMAAKGLPTSGYIEFIAVDPPSYWLNAGDSAGSVYEGRVDEVIKEVCKKYFVTPNTRDSGEVQVSKTKGSSKTKWWMMRQDPKTFIASLLEWSSGITEQGTNWIVSSGGSIDSKPTIYIKEQAARSPVFLGEYFVNTTSPGATDVIDFEVLADNFISVFQKQIITSGLSTISEKYLDRKSVNPKSTQESVIVNDEKTGQKKKTKIGPEQGFAKPRDVPGAVEKPYEWSSSWPSVPEIYSDASIGLNYGEYIDGKARKTFLDMLNLVMRIRLRCNGIPNRKLADSHNLGVSKIKVICRDPDHKIYFIDGDWLIYGFHHIVTRGAWTTDLYCARLDHDSNAKEV